MKPQRKRMLPQGKTVLSKISHRSTLVQIKEITQGKARKYRLRFPNNTELTPMINQLTKTIYHLYNLDLEITLFNMKIERGFIVILDL